MSVACGVYLHRTHVSRQTWVVVQITLSVNFVERTTFERSTAGAAYADSHCQARMHNIISESFKIQTTNNKRVAAAGGEGLVRPLRYIVSIVGQVKVKT